MHVPLGCDPAAGTHRAEQVFLVLRTRTHLLLFYLIVGIAAFLVASCHGGGGGGGVMQVEAWIHRGARARVGGHRRCFAELARDGSWAIAAVDGDTPRRSRQCSRRAFRDLDERSTDGGDRFGDRRRHRRRCRLGDDHGHGRRKRGDRRHVGRGSRWLRSGCGRPSSHVRVNGYRRRLLLGARRRRPARGRRAIRLSARRRKFSLRADAGCGRRWTQLFVDHGG